MREKEQAFLYKKDSKITSVKDLKGKKIAVAKGSSAFNLLYRALDKRRYQCERCKCHSVTTR